MAEKQQFGEDPETLLIKKLAGINTEIQKYLAAAQEIDSDFGEKMRDLIQTPEEPDPRVVERIRNEELGNT